MLTWAVIVGLETFYMRESSIVKYIRAVIFSDSDAS